MASDRTDDGALEAILNPKSIVVVGASTNPAKVGGMPLEFLRRVGYEGRVYGVNPTVKSIAGYPVVRSVSELEEPADLAVIALPADRAVQSVRECGAAGVRAAVVLSSGFAETGEAGSRLQSELLSASRQFGIRLLGPNCAGVMNVRSRMTASFGSHLAADTTLIPGSIGIVSQSGAVGAYLFTLARQRSIGLSSWVTTGNEVDTQLADYVMALADDPATTVIVIYAEQIRDATVLAAACDRALSAGKHLVGILSGRTEASAQALRSHTAAMAGDRDVAVTALEHMGITLVRRIDELLDAAITLASPKQPSNDGVGIVTISGAAGIMMVDHCSDRGLTVPALKEEAQAELTSILPFAATSNPVDVTGSISSRPEIFAPALSALTRDRSIGSVVCFLGHIGLSPHVGERLVDEMTSAAQNSSKPISVIGLFGAGARIRLMDAGIAVFTDPTAAIEAIAVGRRAARLRPRGLIPAGDSPGQPDPASKTRFLSEVESQERLARFGVRFPRQAHAIDRDGAESAAAAMQGELVLKVVSPDLPHKSDVGGVRVGVRQENVGSAFEEILREVAERAGHATLHGIVIQELAKGYPVIVGGRRDPVFGPVVLVGHGGIYAEVLGKPALMMAPVDAESAARGIAASGVGSVVGSNRGQQLDEEALIGLVLAVSSTLVESYDIRSLELNPVLVGRNCAIAVDALVEVEDF
jgi:acyl-CoA synthetase (NDP forming)